MSGVPTKNGERSRPPSASQLHRNGSAVSVNAIHQTRAALTTLSICGEPDKLEAALQQLCKLVSIRECVEVIVNFGPRAVGLLISDALTTSVNNPRIIVAACATIEALVQNSSELRLQLENAGILRFMQAVAVRHPADAFVQGSVLSALAVMVEYAEPKPSSLRSQLRKDKSLPFLMSTLSTHQQDELVQECVCKILALCLQPCEPDFGSEEMNLECISALDWLLRSGEYCRVVSSLMKHSSEHSVQLAACMALLEMANHPALRSQFVSDRVHEYLSQTLKDQHSYEYGVAAVSLLAKLAQVDDWEVHGQLISAGVLEVVADASQKHFASAEFQQCACLVLEHLAKMTIQSDSAVEKWLLLLEKMMLEHRMSDGVQTGACRAIAALVSVDPSLQDLIGDVGEEIMIDRKTSTAEERDMLCTRKRQDSPRVTVQLHHLIVIALNVHGDQGHQCVLAEAACQALYWICEENPRLRRLVLQKGAHHTIVSCLQHHPLVAALNEWGLRALHELSRGSERHYNEVYNSSAHTVALAALKAFLSDDRIQQEAIGLLTCLCLVKISIVGSSGISVRSDQFGQVAAIKFCDEGFVSLVMRALCHHESKIALVESAFEAVSVLLDLLPTQRAEIMEMNAVDVILQCMSCYVEELGIQTKGCMLLHYLATKEQFSDESVAEDSVDGGVIAGVPMDVWANTAMIGFPVVVETSPSVSPAIKRALAKLDRKSKKKTGNLQRRQSQDFVDLGVMADSEALPRRSNAERCVDAACLITVALRNFAEDDVLLSEACLAIKELAEHGDKIKRCFVEQSAHRHLFKVLRRDQIPKVLLDDVCSAVHVLCSSTLKNRMLLQCVEDGDGVVARFLLQSGADVNCIDAYHNITPLSWAARNGDLDLTNILLQYDVSDLRAPLREALDIGADSIIARLLQAIVSEQRLPAAAVLSGYDLQGLRSSWLERILTPTIFSALSSRRPSVALDGAELKAQRLLIGYHAAQRRASGTIDSPLSNSPYSRTRISSCHSDSEHSIVSQSSIEEESYLDSLHFAQISSAEEDAPLVKSASFDQIFSMKGARPDERAFIGTPSLYSDTSPSQEPPEIRPLTRKLIVAPPNPLDDEDLKSPLTRIAPRLVRGDSRSVTGVAFLPFSGEKERFPLVGSVSSQSSQSNVSAVSSSSVLRAKIKASTFVSSPQTMRLNMLSGSASLPEIRSARHGPAPSLPLATEGEIQHAAAKALRTPQQAPRLSRVVPAVESLTELDISDNGIETLEHLLEPPSIATPLSQLAFLNLAHNKLREFPISLARVLDNLRHLQISSNCLTTFPPAFFLLHSLERLSMTSNEIESLDDFTEPLQSVKHAREGSPDDISTSRSSSRPMSPIGPRTGRVSPLPPSPTATQVPLAMLLSEPLTELSELQLSENRLKTLPADFHDAFPFLKSLALGSNRLVTLPPIALEFNKLTKLDLSGNQLTELSAELFNGCSSLEHLKADSNKISQLPSVACAETLESLVHVSLAGNNLAQSSPDFMPPFLLHLPRLRYIDISSNQLKGLPPPAAWQGKGLRTILAAHNKVESLELGRNAGLAWPVIDRLNLQDNELQTIPSNIGDLATLSSLNLDGNKALTRLPSSFGRLKKLWEFPRQNLPNLDLDPPLKLSRTREIVNYMQDRNEHAAPYYRIRMLVVGRAEQGKTSLVRLVTGNLAVGSNCGVTYSPGVVAGVSGRVSLPAIGGIGAASSKVPMALNSIATVGVSVHDWKCYRRIKGKQLPYTISCWDFAGQEEYYSTHQCFLSSRSLYLAVYNMKDDQAIEKLKPWLLNIQARAPGCPVLAVGTHLDLVEPAQSQKAMARLREKLDKMRGKPGMPKIVGHEFVDASRKNPSIATLRSAIFSAIDNAKTASGQPILGGTVPAVYLALEDRIVQEAKRMRLENSAYPIIHERRMRQLANELTGKEYGSEKLTKEKMMQAVRFLHESGVLLHYEDSQSNLSDLYFLDPEWLCSMMAKIVTHKEVNGFLHDGVMERSLVDHLFVQERKRLPSKFIPQYLRLLERFEIVLSHEKDGKPHLLIPSMLPTKRQVVACPGFGLRRIIRHYQMPYIPLGFMARLIARIYLFADSMLDSKPEKTIWRSGVHMLWPHMAYCVVELIGNSSHGSENDSREQHGLGFDCEADTVVMEVTCNPSGRQLLGNLADHFDTLVEEWYSGLCEVDVQGNSLIKTYAVCPDCAETPVDPTTGEAMDSYRFSLEDLVRQSEGSAMAECPFHSTMVPIRDLAPDIMLGDLPDRLILDPAKLQFDATSAHRLGKGGFGDVYRWTYQGAAVAVKVFKCRGGDTSSSPNRSLRQEVQVMRHLQHPSVIDLVGVQLEPRLLVMELAPQGSLRSLLERQEPLFRPVQHRIAAQVAEGLEFLHRKRILYRDLKTDNVLIFSTNATARINAKISDYGISRFACPAGLAATTGTAGYRPPEMIRARGKMAYDFSADIYSFGLFLFELVTAGKRPFEELDFPVELDNRYLEEAPIPQLTECDCQPWPDMQDMIAQCLMTRPDQRPAASALVQRFRSAESLCLRQAVPVSMGLSVQALAVRNYRDARGNERCQVWIGSGSTAGEGSQLSIYDLSEQPSPPSGMALSDRLVLSMISVQLNHKPLLVLVGCLSGKLWRYDAVRGRQQQPHLITTLKDAIVSLLHFDDGQETNVIVAGLADGTLAVIEHSQLMDASTGGVEPSLIDLGPHPIMDLCTYKRQVWCACGPQVIVLDIGHREVIFSWSTTPDTKCKISNLVISGDLLWTSIKGSAVVHLWSASEPIGRERGEFNCLDFIREREPPEEQKRVPADWHIVSMLLNGGSLWVGMSSGHVIVVDVTKRQAQAVIRRHDGAVRCIASVKVRIGDKPLSYVLTGGMGYLPRPHMKENMFRREGVSFQSSDSTYGHLLVWDACLGKMQVRMDSDYAKRYAPRLPKLGLVAALSDAGASRSDSRTPLQSRSPMVSAGASLHQNSSSLLGQPPSSPVLLSGSVNRNLLDSESFEGSFETVEMPHSPFVSV